MPEVPIGEALPDVAVDVEDGQYVTGAVCFVMTEDPVSHQQHVQMTATDGLSGVVVRGLVELGRDLVVADQERS